MATNTSSDDALTTTQINRKQLFIASCIALIATALVFSIRADILGDFKKDFSLDDVQAGWINFAALWGFVISIFLGGMLLDVIGTRAILILAFIGQLLGTIFTIYANGYGFLLGATLVIGIGNGFVEAGVNPLIATVYSDTKTARLNALHAWWPGGLVIGSGLAWGFTKFSASWQVKMWTILIPVCIYGIMLLSLKFPKTERVQSGVTTSDMYKEGLNPFFILWFVCMLFTAATELGTAGWIPEMMKSSGIENGILVLGWISLIMLLGRSFAGPFVHRLSPVGLLIASSVISCVGLVWMGRVSSPGEAFLASFFFAVGVCFFWPTMLGVTSERFPKGGSFLLGLMGAGGMAAAGFSNPWLGKLKDLYGTGGALQRMAILPAVLICVFLAIYLYDKTKGGYKIVKLSADDVITEGEGAEAPVK